MGKEVKGKPTTYQEQYENAVKSGDVEVITSSILRFEKPGQAIVGLLQSAEDFEEGQFGAQVKRYTMVTDEDIVTFILGSSYDKDIERAQAIGKICRIEYIGKKTLPDGRQKNFFRIEVVGRAS